MTRRLTLAALMLASIVGSGCHSCGDRPRLFSRLRDRDHDDEPRRTAAERDPRDCDPCRPVSFRGSKNIDRGEAHQGQPVSWQDNGQPVGSMIPSYPAGGMLPGYSSQPGLPVYPGSPGYSAPLLPRGDELPLPGGYQPIPAPGVPSSPYAIPKPADSSFQSTPRGGATSTADIKKK